MEAIPQEVAFFQISDSDFTSHWLKDSQTYDSTINVYRFVAAQSEDEDLRLELEIYITTVEMYKIVHERNDPRDLENIGDLLTSNYFYDALTLQHNTIDRLKEIIEKQQN